MLLPFYHYLSFYTKDPAIGANDTGYRPYDWGNELNVFIKDGDTGGNLFGKVISHRLS